MRYRSGSLVGLLPQGYPMCARISLAAVVAFERGLILERTHERLARAKAQEKELGRPKGSLDKKKRSRRGYFARWAD